MPNPANILSPVTLVGNGRSGTSLLSRVIAAHPDFSFAGESVNLIHSVWRSLESSLPPQRAAEIPEVVRRQFLQLFPSEKARWIHKPIGIPIVGQLFGDEEEFYDWFWEVLEASFPEADYFTVLRHPLDVLVSSHRWWGRGYRTMIESNRRVARLLSHPRSPVEFAVNYHDLVAEPEPRLRELFEHLGIDLHPACLEQLDVAHVVSETEVSGGSEEARRLARRRADGFSHREAWGEIDRDLLTPAYREAVEACWDSFGQSFGDWPF